MTERRAPRRAASNRRTPAPASARRGGQPVTGLAATAAAVGNGATGNGAAVSGKAARRAVSGLAGGGAPGRAGAATPETRGAARASRAPIPPSVNGRVPDIWDERVADALRFLRRRLTGEYEVDEFGFDSQLCAAVMHPMLRALYRHYFRVEVSGVHHLPPDGPALIVANHSGMLPMDALMLLTAVHDETPRHRNLRLLGADLVFRVPILSELARKAGATLACGTDAERLLRSGEYVGVFPEGFKGIGKPYRERYRLQRFGRGGFVSSALRTQAPIIPAAIVGAEEIYPILGNIRPLARVTGLPYVPVTPFFPLLGPLGLIPLPSKWLIEFGEPIPTIGYGDDADDPIVVFNLADQVRETIQQTLHTLLQRRPEPFS